MLKYIKYKDYIGEYSYIEEDQEFYGDVLGLDCVVGFCGQTEEELFQDLKNAIKDYEEDFKKEYIPKSFYKAKILLWWKKSFNSYESIKGNRKTKEERR